ncbi:hypothetical protein XENTR_v10006622 [Xenopus tropicalis]|nr:hypothetical protein XENTR_v10006622 [Xenopus tropicalis]
MFNMSLLKLTHLTTRDVQMCPRGKQQERNSQHESPSIFCFDKGLETGIGGGFSYLFHLVSNSVLACLGCFGASISLLGATDCKASTCLSDRSMNNVSSTLK